MSLGTGDGGELRPRPSLQLLHAALLLFSLSSSQVSSPKQSCLVTFEDNSKYWVLWKDIQHGECQEFRVPLSMSSPLSPFVLAPVLVHGAQALGTHLGPTRFLLV